MGKKNAVYWGKGPRRGHEQKGGGEGGHPAQAGKKKEGDHRTEKLLVLHVRSGASRPRWKKGEGTRKKNVKRECHLLRISSFLLENHRVGKPERGYIHYHPVLSFIKEGDSPHRRHYVWKEEEGESMLTQEGRGGRGSKSLFIPRETA